MKPGLFIALLLGCGGWVRAQEDLPQNRQAVIVQEIERNPFGQRTTQATVIEQVETEESRLRAFLQHLPIGGISNKQGVFKALLGSLSVQAGQNLPPLLAGQSERLVVRAVTATEIELAFVEKDGTSETRIIILPVDVKAHVRYRLETQSAAEKGAAKSTQSLQGVVKDNADPSPSQ